MTELAAFGPREAGSLVASAGATGGFVPPVYPFDKLSSLGELARRHEGGVVDLSIGTPCDPPPGEVLEALATSGTERGYPSSVGTTEFREAASLWMSRRLGVNTDASAIAACVGTKEFVAGVPHWLHLRTPGRDTVLYPRLSYPTYEMGAILARCRAVPVPTRSDGTMDLAAISEEDAARALCLWVNSPGNPGGGLEDLAAVAQWGRTHAVPVLSDECYIEFTWAGRGHTILEHGPEGVLAVHSLSKRSNLAGLRAGFFAGDPDLVAYLSRLRQHAGFMVPGPVQHAAAVALGDDAHVDRQRATYLGRLQLFAKVLGEAGIHTDLPAGSFYLWVTVPESFRSAEPAGVPSADRSAGPSAGGSLSWALATWLAGRGGVLVTPGDTYGPAGADHVRVALVQPTDRLELVARRLATARIDAAVAT